MKYNIRWLPEVEILRATAIILIVLCHLHIFINIGVYNGVFTKISEFVAAGGLSLFFFISGLSLSHSNSGIDSYEDAIKFYKKRFFRIYPLYLVALILEAILDYQLNNINLDREYHKFIISAVGAQGLVSDDVLHWFIGVILLFYLIFPILVFKDPSTVTVFKRSFFILIIFILLRVMFGLIRYSVFLYYPVFVFGVIICELSVGNMGKLIKKSFLLFLISLSFFSFPVATFIWYPSNSSYLKHIFFSVPLIIGCLIAYSLAKSYFSLVPIRVYRLLSLISSSSFEIYLSHGFVLYLLVSFFSRFSISSSFINIIVIVVGLPAVVLTGQCIKMISKNLVYHNLRIL